jgi:hypothetical protein
MKTEDLLGGAWLVASYGIERVMPLTVQSRIGRRRTTQVADGIRSETFVEAMRSAAQLRGLLSGLFDRIDTDERVAWIEHEPSGPYARRASRSLNRLKIRRGDGNEGHPLQILGGYLAEKIFRGLRGVPGPAAA